MVSRPILFIALFLVLACARTQELTQVERVVDGDTFVLIGGERVRLIGIDTPETVHPDRPIEPFGKEASAFLKKMIEGRSLRLEYDVQERDRYGRLLAYVYLEDGTFVNEELLRSGLARVSTVPPNVKYADRFLDVQAEARAKGTGMWGRE